MSRIKYVFLDLDDTILDFKRSESEAIKSTLLHFGYTPTEELIKRYSEINREMWQRLERREMTRAEIRTERFGIFLAELGASVSPEYARDIYEDKLAAAAYFLPEAKELLEHLRGRYHLYLASNGTAKIQRKRIDAARLSDYFDAVFISDDIGYNKPSKEFFDYCFSSIKDFKKEEAVIVGDSLTSDIKGGLNAGISTCLYNPDGKEIPDSIRPDKEIRSLKELPLVLESI